jgi:hypothetical protein
MDQNPYTIEQYQRCLQAASKLSYAVYNMKINPLITDILNDIYNAQKEYSDVMTEVVNESCGL